MSATTSRLIEREEPARRLEDSLRRAVDGSGRVIVVSGEAGIGKTTLLRAFVDAHRQSHSIFWGHCDALSTPRPLGPLHDIAAKLDPTLAHQLESGAAPTTIFARLLAALEAHRKLPILIFEDVHWADKATLDLIKYLGRRITSLRALLLLSFRSDEVTRDHPINGVLVDFSPSSIQRLEIAPLSLDGVRQMANGTAFDAVQLHRSSAGNPFLVSELIVSGNEARTLPTSVKELLRSRRARIGKSANVALEALSIFPSAPTRRLLERMLGTAGTRGCEACTAAGLLVRGDEGNYHFRHELARLVVLEDMPERRRKALHAKARSCLEHARGAGVPIQISTIFHHAAGAGDGSEVLRLAPLAASEAARMGAHAQAAEHLSAALAHVALATPAQAAELYENWSYEAALAVKIDERIIDARHRAIELWRSIGRQDKVGLNLRWLARLHWYRGEAGEAEKYLSEALAVLEALPPGPELAMA